MINFQQPVELMGVPGSPYTRKMLALLRYRRIAYRLLPGSRYRSDSDRQRFRERPQPRIRLLPTFYYRDEQGAEQAVCDSTVIIRELEAGFKERSVIPDDPVLGFIDYVLEDYADEWLTKAMFHYRWSYAADIEKAGQMLPRWNNITAPDREVAEKSREISELQISRLRYVGSNEHTRDTIEESFGRFLDLFDKHLNQFPFLLGHRPSAADFGVYGQLTCLALFDPTPQQLILTRAPRVYAWTEVMEDLSGHEILANDWLDPADLPGTLLELLREAGRVYAPCLLANEAALNSGDDRVNTVIDGRPWRQNPFPYQARCLHWIREAHARLSEGQKEQLSPILDRADLLCLVR